MIKITIDEATQKKLVDLHWIWFNNRSETKFQKTDITYKNFITTDLGISWNDVYDIITGNITTLNRFIQRLGVILESDNKERYHKLMLAFGYDNFCESKKIWNAYEFCRRLKTSVCPYCNREYIFTIGDIKDKTVRPELDHFFPKSRYPYLSCSFFNFIPSCHICNHGKRESGTGIIYPYEEDFGEKFPVRVKFKKEVYEPVNLLDIKNTHVFFEKKCGHLLEQDLCEVCKKAPKIKASIKTFHIEDIYNEHKIELKDLFDRYRNYCEPKRKDILRLFYDHELNHIGHLNEKQIDAILSLYAKKMKKTFLGLPLSAEGKEYPLRKFKEDIIEQLDTTARKMKKRLNKEDD